VVEKGKAGKYVVKFDEAVPFNRQEWNPGSLTVHPDSWKKTPPTLLLKDLIVSDRIGARVSHFVDSKQIVGTVVSRESSSTRYYIRWDAGQYHSFTPTQRFTPGSLQLGDESQKAISSTKMTKTSTTERTLADLHMDYRIGARVSVTQQGRDWHGVVTEKRLNLYVVKFDEAVPSNK